MPLTTLPIDPAIRAKLFPSLGTAICVHTVEEFKKKLADSQCTTGVLIVLGKDSPASFELLRLWSDFFKGEEGMRQALMILPLKTKIFARFCILVNNLNSDEFYHLGIKSLPTLLRYSPDGKIVKQAAGAIDFKEFKAFATA